MNKYKYVITICLFISVFLTFPLYSQETESESDEVPVIESTTENETVETEETPVEEPPAEEPPAGEPPAGEPPAGEPPAGEPPAGEPPAGETPAGETPAGETPAEETPAEEIPAEETEKEKGHLSFFVDNKMIFAFSVTDGGFGFGGTANFQYVFPFNLSFGLEGGYYGFRSDIENEGSSVVGGFTILPVYLTASFNIPIVENFYITPVLKGGGAYTRARINGWLGGDTFSGLFEGGVRFKAYMRGGLLIHGGIMYTGLIERSGLFSMMNISFGLGL